MAEFDPLYFLEGANEVGAVIRAFDWRSTPLGPLETWPVALKTAVSAMLNSRFPAAIAWGSDLITIYNDAFLPILGSKPEAIGRPFSEVWAEAWSEIGPIAARTFEGEPTFIEDFPLTINRHGYPELAYFTFCYSPLRSDDGRVAGMLDTVIETTGKVEAEREIHIVNAELQHRIKNTLTLVVSIVNQTLRNLPGAEPARETLLQRLTALANTHDILTAKGSRAAEISEVIAAALSPYDATHTRFSMAGPRVRLSERQSLSLALAVNELTTNAIKYGALREPDGRVRISWSLDGGTEARQFRFTWKEVGGPLVEPPSRKGFGSLLMERVVAKDFEGTAILTYAPSGLFYEIVSETTVFAPTAPNMFSV